MEVTTTALAGVLIVQPKVFADARGFFLESFNQRQFDAAVGAPVSFVQDNHSRSAQGVLRGLHMQVGAHPQGKLVRVTSGRIFDVAVDVRAGSPTYRQWVGVELDDVAHRQLWIPPGLAHGFLVLSERADALTQRGASLKKYVDAWRPLFQTLDDGQKVRLRFAAAYLMHELRDAIANRLSQYADEDESDW